MNRESIHRKIRELIELLELNNNRLFLQDDEISSFDTEYLKQLALSLYQQIDTLGLNSSAGVDHSSHEKRDSTTEVKIEKPQDKVVEKPVEKLVPKTILTDKLLEDLIEAEENMSSQEDIAVETADELENEVAEEVVEAFTERIVEKEDIVKFGADEKVEESKPIKTVENTPSKKNLKSSSGDIYENLKNRKIESIKKGISIQKRYQIQNELFQKDPEIYDKSIKELDGADSLDNANTVFARLAGEFGWDLEDTLVEELQTILLRRYM